MSPELNNSEYDCFKYEHGSGNHLYGARNSHVVLDMVSHTYTRFLLFLGPNFNISALHFLFPSEHSFMRCFITEEY